MLSFVIKSISDSLPPQFLRCLGGALLLCIIPAGAQCAAPRRLSAQQLETDLARYKKIRSLESDFRQVKTLVGAHLDLKSTGHLSLKRVQGKSEVDWLLRDPAYLRLHVTESHLEMFEAPDAPAKPLVEGQELQAKILRPIYAWLSVNAALIAEQYDVFAEGRGKFRLEPKDKAAPVKSISLTLDARRLVREVSVQEASGDHLVITFTGTKTTE